VGGALMRAFIIPVGEGGGYMRNGPDHMGVERVRALWSFPCIFLWAVCTSDAHLHTHIHTHTHSCPSVCLSVCLGHNLLCSPAVSSPLACLSVWCESCAVRLFACSPSVCQSAMFPSLLLFPFPTSLSTVGLFVCSSVCQWCPAGFFQHTHTHSLWGAGLFAWCGVWASYVDTQPASQPCGWLAGAWMSLMLIDLSCSFKLLEWMGRSAN